MCSKQTLVFSKLIAGNLAKAGAISFQHLILKYLDQKHNRNSFFYEKCNFHWFHSFKKFIFKKWFKFCRLTFFHQNVFQRILGNTSLLDIHTSFGFYTPEYEPPQPVLPCLPLPSPSQLESFGLLTLFQNLPNNCFKIVQVCFRFIILYQWVYILNIARCIVNSSCIMACKLESHCTLHISNNNRINGTATQPN